MTDTLSIDSAPPEQVREQLKEDQSAELIDVRTPVEYREVHAEGARNVPLDMLDPADLKAYGDPDRRLYLICRSGSRSRQACQKLISAGQTNVVNVEGGTQEWKSQGLPVLRGEKSMSLDRQVRVAAGATVSVSVLFGWAFHPAWTGFAWFVGAGLLFAGITDSCGMGMLLAKMPWNQPKR